MIRPTSSEDDVDECPLKLWAKESGSGRHELLAVIDRFVCCLPVTSVCSEFIFSTAGIIRQKIEPEYCQR